MVWSGCGPLGLSSYSYKAANLFMGSPRMTSSDPISPVKAPLSNTIDVNLGIKFPAHELWGKCSNDGRRWVDKL